MLFGPWYDTRSVDGRWTASSLKWSGVSTTLARRPAASTVRTVFAGCDWAKAGSASDERISVSSGHGRICISTHLLSDDSTTIRVVVVNVVLTSVQLVRCQRRRHRPGGASLLRT